VRHWLIMFRPETYQTVRDHSVIGVRMDHRKRFALISSGDLFVAYISRRGLLDGYGRIVGNIREDDTPLFGADTSYPLRCDVEFDRANLATPVGELLWHLDQWNQMGKELRTHPANMLFCYGGFMEIQPSDYRHLRSAMGYPLSD